MASTPLNHTSGSIFLPTVCLYDWWLIQAEEEFQGKRLGVGGFTSPKEGSVKRAIRMFKSAPITKVFDFSTLETADNVCVIIKGLMNKSLSSKNGFSSEVCKHFILGFPSNWEKVVAEQGSCSPLSKTSSGSDLPRNDSDKTRAESSGRPVHHNKEQRSLHQKRNASIGDGDIATSCEGASRNAENCFGSSLPKDGSEETRDEPLSPPPLIKSGGHSHGHAKVRSSDSFKRSRSGRILMPRLAFWRNEVPIYDADRNVAGVQVMNDSPESKDSLNAPRRK